MGDDEITDSEMQFSVMRRRESLNLKRISYGESAGKWKAMAIAVDIIALMTGVSLALS